MKREARAIAYASHLIVRNGNCNTDPIDLLYPFNLVNFIGKNRSAECGLVMQEGWSSVLDAQEVVRAAFLTVRTVSRDSRECCCRTGETI
jgi:hypothetical protein